MTECYSCKYFIQYPNNGVTCLMKNSFYIVEGKNVFPKECIDFERGFDDRKN